MKQYQATYSEAGHVESVQELPPETPRKRTLVVRAKTKSEAIEAAKRLYSLAK